jgi:hypothetical protein
MDERRRREVLAELGANTGMDFGDLTEEAPDLVFHGTQDVLDLLADTASQCRRGELDCKVSNCLGYLASVALRALSEGETEKRLEALEEQLARLVPASGRNGHAPRGPRPVEPVG